MKEINPKPKIAVIGAGAIGSLIGGLLSRAGEDVTLIARPAHVQAIQAKGLRIEGVLGTLTIPVKASETLDFHPDLALLAVKTQDVESACGQFREKIQGSPLLTLQNGIRSDELVASVLPKEDILSGVVMLNSRFLQPGVITFGRLGSLLIGEAFGKNGARTRQIQSLLQRAIPTSLSGNIQGVHWTKLLVNNLINGLEAMTGMSIRECMRIPALKRIGILTLRESHQVIQKAGYHLASLPYAPAPVLQAMLHAPLPLAEWILCLTMGSLKTISSTLQSLRRGRPTEIDYLNGEIVRMGLQVGVPTPYNSKVVEIVKKVEQSGQFPPLEEVLGAFKTCKGDLQNRP